MEQAREWLNNGKVLDKQGGIDIDALGNQNTIASTAVHHLQAIQKDVNSHAPSPNKVDPPDLIPIAVEDLKIIVQLVKLIVVYGVYPCLPPVAASQLSQNIQPWPRPDLKRLAVDSPEVQSIIKGVYRVLQAQDDVSRQLLMSPLLHYILFVLSFTPDHFNSVMAMFPTFHAYKLLLRLMVLDPTNSVAKSKIASLVVERKDAVRSLIEIVFRPDETQGISLDHVQQVVLILASPVSVPVVSYIGELGLQLFSLLTSSEKIQSESSALVIQKLATIQPKLVGKLRNLIVEPFEMKGGEVGRSLLALYRLAYYGDANKQSNKFVQHLCEKLTISVWLLAVTTCDNNTIPESVVQAMVAIIEVFPQSVVKIVESLVVKNLPGNLNWFIDSQGVPQLMPVVTSKASNQDVTLTQLIDDRLSCLVCIFGRLEDDVATKALILLMQVYSLESSGATTSDLTKAMSTLLQAKTIERLTQDENIKAKLFDKPAAVVEFAFSVLTPKISRLPENGSPDSATVEKNMLSLDIGDSDDEDSDDDNAQTDSNISEDDTMTDLALSLLGTAIMESLADEKDPLVLTDEQKSLLQSMTSNKTLSKQLRARADFCWELINGGKRMGKTLDTANKKEVLNAAYEALSEPLVPSRAYGLHLITKLLEQNAITLPAAMEIYLRELSDEDSYIYLNALKGIEAAGRSHNTSEIITFLLPLIDSSNGKVQVDTALRAREALIRLLTPGSLHTVSDKLVETLVHDITSVAKSKVDYRFRLSSAAILGIIIAQYPMSIDSNMHNVIADCALGILRHETEQDDVPLRRSAAILALEIINAVNSESQFNVSTHILESLRLEMESLAETSTDTTLVEHCKAVLSAIS